MNINYYNYVYYEVVIIERKIIMIDCLTIYTINHTGSLLVTKNSLHKYMCTNTWKLYIILILKGLN